MDTILNQKSGPVKHGRYTLVSFWKRRIPFLPPRVEVSKEDYSWQFACIRAKAMADPIVTDRKQKKNRCITVLIVAKIRRYHNPHQIRQSAVKLFEKGAHNDHAAITDATEGDASTVQH